MSSEAKRAYMREYMRKRRAGMAWTGRAGGAGHAASTAVPDHVLAEREQRRSLFPTSLTALICGDPLPGRSALDQRA